MRIIRRRIGRIAPTDIDSTQVNESGKIGIQSNLITYPKFPPANLVVTSTVQATPEWFESWRQTVEFFVDQRMQQNLLPLQQMINSMIEEKIQDYQLSGVQMAESTNQLELTKEQIKEVILKEIKIGQVFYPSDIANKFGLDLITVMDAINELQKDGKLKNAGNVNVGSS